MDCKNALIATCLSSAAPAPLGDLPVGFGDLCRQVANIQVHAGLS